MTWGSNPEPDPHDRATPIAVGFALFFMIVFAAFACMGLIQEAFR